MHLIVIGGGLLGLSSALALREAGHAVALLEAREGSGLETSYANGAMLTPSMSDPWNAPGLFGHLLHSLADPRAPMKLRLRALPSLFGWGVGFLRHATPERYQATTLANFRLAAESVARTRDWRERYRLDYQASTLGTIKLFRSAAAMAGPLAHARRLARHGLAFRSLDADETVALEPALAGIGGEIAGALQFPDDESGDAHRFCRAVEAQLAEQGVALHFGRPAVGLVTAGGRVVGVETTRGPLRADGVIVAAGSASTALLKGVGLRLPVQPVKGYSVTLDGLAPLPLRPVIDDAMHAAVVPVGERLRLVGTAEFCGFDPRLDPQRIDNLRRIFAGLYPALAARVPPGAGEPWAGFRPMSADGRAFIGPSRLPGLWLNTGHGHLGWTMAAGSACLLADLINGRAPAIDPTPFLPTRAGC